MATDRLTEKYIKILHQKGMMAELVRLQFDQNCQKNFDFMVHLLFLGKIPKQKDRAEYVEEEDKAAHRAVRKVMNSPEFNDMFNEHARAEILRAYPKALDRMSQQIDDEKNPWLANKAANDIATRYDRIQQKDDGNVVTVRFEGMPEIGVPDTDEQE